MNIRRNQPTQATAIMGLMVVSVMGAVCFSTRSSAQEVMLKSSIANWSIYCLKDVTEIKPQDCSLVTAAVGKDNASAWVKMGIALSSPQEMEMTIRTPRLNYFRKGISITKDGAQLGRAFIDKCTNTFCQSTIAVDSRMLDGLLAAHSLTFEYQTSDEEGVALAVNVREFSRALGELYQVVFPALVAMPLSANLKEWTFTVELRKNPNISTSMYTWGARYPNCYGSPSTKTVSVSNLTIQDDQKFEEWLNDSLRCPEAVVWVTGETQDAFGEANKYKVYMKVKDKMRYVVTTDATGQPLVFSQEPSLFTYK
jgi:invasion protein IalB